MEKCQKCIIPDSFPNITIEDGLCSFCREQASNVAKTRDVRGRDQLSALLKTRKTASYDCAVPLSGGKDSSYILYYMVRELNLKPLAIFFDNGFITEMAKRNIERICTALGVDLVVGKASPYRRKQLKEALLMSGSLGQLVKYCGNCENNLRSFTLNEAAQRNIDYLIWGSTDFEDTAQSFEASSPSGAKKFREKYGTFRYMAGKPLQHLQKLAGSTGQWGNKLQAFGHGVKYLFYCLCDNYATKAPEGWRKLNPFLQVTFARKPVQVVYFFDYVPYDPYRHIETLREELQWEAPEGQEIRFDCKLASLKNVQYLLETGLTAFGFTLSTLIRNDLLQREEAIKRENRLRRRLLADCRQLADQVGVDIDNVLKKIET
ncbi:MAG: hypothetical protein A2Y79_10370 [Deltaproteobacteria bacterium RBG_13_43_22]|nr:MAG: hypothetical protein A2Y79_10370 [Deltaproteobacteria bacterium RBG_13_43_22]